MNKQADPPHLHCLRPPATPNESTDKRKHHSDNQAQRARNIRVHTPARDRDRRRTACVVVNEREKAVDGEQERDDEERDRNSGVPNKDRASHGQDDNAGTRSGSFGQGHSSIGLLRTSPGVQLFSSIPRRDRTAEGPQETVRQL